MIFSYDLDIPSLTLITAPVRLEARLPPGTVHQVDVQFPSGCVGLVHLQIFRGASQVWPSNPSEDFHASGLVISWQDQYPVDDAPFAFRLSGWNEDDTYAHLVTVRFAVRAFPAPTEAEIRARARAAGIQVIEI